MRLTCSECGGAATVTSRPTESRSAAGVYWRNYAVCGFCGCTSAYEFTGKVVYRPDNWQPIKELLLDIDQVELVL